MIVDPLLDTNRELSFYSGHTAVAAGLSATATYLAFERDPDGWQPWVLLGSGALITGFVGVQRVRSRSHFPTDILAGAVFGAAIGVLVPHMHLMDPEARTQLGFWGDAQGAGATLSFRH